MLYRYQLSRKLEQIEVKRIKEIDALKTRLYTSITHEFRTPLTVIQGMTDQLPENSEAKKLILRNAKALLRLVNQLLDMAKIESGKMKLSLMQGDIIAYVSYLTESFKSYAESNNIELDFSSEINTLIIDYDAEKFQHILTNLISNAIKFSSTNGMVSVNVYQSQASPGSKVALQLHIEVTDNGIGIEKEHLPFIFNRYYQVDSSLHSKNEGTGIGLAHTKELVELMGGSISVESNNSSGSRFSINLPVIKAYDTVPNAAVEDQANQLFLSQAKLDNEAASNIQEAQKQAFVDEINLPVLLIVEDNEDVATYIETCVRGLYQIHLAKDGQLGIDKALELIPDVIISDVMMPGKNGYELTGILKNDQRTSHVPIILLTARADADSKLEGLIRGADAYLAKPFDKKELVVRLKKLVELRRKLHERYVRPLPPRPTKDPGLQLEDSFLSKAQKAVLDNLDNSDYGVSELCKTMAMSQSQLYRKIKALTDKSIAAYIRSIRLYRGYELLQSSDLSVSEVAYDVGFSDPNYFSKTFSKEFGFPPSDV